MATPKILIGYASAGHGHEKAAKAVQEACEEILPHAHVECVDTLKISPGPFGEIYKQIYLLQIKYAPWLWGFFYYSIDFAFTYFFIQYVRRILNALTMGQLEKKLIQENPDVVVATHFTIIEVASYLKKKKLIQSKLAVIVTDYYPHYVWTAVNVDLYFVAAEETKRSLVDRGIPAEKIKITGIPIEKKFSLPVNVEAIRQKLGLSADKETALLTSGGGGIGAMENIATGILELSQNAQVIVVCGTNQALLQKLTALTKKYSALKPLGFVDNMHELMAVSDFVVGKGGGLTITESFAKARPVVLFRPVPGQEARNALFVKRHGAGFSTNDLLKLEKLAKNVISNPELLKKLKKSVEIIAKPNAAKEVVTLLTREFGI